MKKIIINVILALAALGALGLSLLCAVNNRVLLSTADKIVSVEEAAALDADCILVLGAGVNGEQPSLMLADRLERGMELYFAGAAEKLLMSGDHGREDYDEVNVMKEQAVAAGADPSDVFMDHAGFSTYESLYRARDVFLAKRIIIVTQPYHLPRALYIAAYVYFVFFDYCKAAAEYLYAYKSCKDSRKSVSLGDLFLSDNETEDRKENNNCNG